MALVEETSGGDESLRLYHHLLVIGCCGQRYRWRVETLADARHGRIARLAGNDPRQPRHNHAPTVVHIGVREWHGERNCE